MLPSLDYSGPYYGQKGSSSCESRLSYYNDEQIRLVMDDVAQHLGCHVEKVDLLFNQCDFTDVIQEWE